MRREIGRLTCWWKIPDIQKPSFLISSKSDGMQIDVKRNHGKLFEFTGASTESNVLICGSPALEQGNSGFRPTELVLAGLGGCMSIDVLNILYKQRQSPESFDIKVNGTRAEEIPSLFEEITLTIIVTGDIKPEKLEHAIRLSATKYCTVYKILECTAQIKCKYLLNGQEAEI